MRFLSSLLFALVIVAAVHADMGFGGGKRWLIANYQATFEGLDKYPDYVFFLVSNTGMSTVGDVPKPLHVGDRLFAVSKATVGETAWKPEWETSPGTFHSPSLLTSEKRIQSSSPATVTVKFRFAFTKGGDLDFEKISENEDIPPDTSSSSDGTFLGLLYGGCGLTLVIAAGGLFLIIRLARGKSRAAR